MVILMRLWNIIRKLLNKTEKHNLIKITENFLKKSIEQTITEISEFNFKEWKQKYNDELFYFLFEQIFRGKSKDIKERQKVYIEYVKQAQKNNPEKSWLDIGCGRGEFLEFLSEQGIKCVGVDSNKVFVELCLKKGLNVINIDAISYLSYVEDNFFAGISCIQVIEHFERRSLNEFVKLCYRKISSGGYIIIETVNVKNPTANVNYWLDPSHNLPLMPEFLSMFLEFVGFNNVSILYLSHSQKSKNFTPNVFPDCAVIGMK